MYQDAIEANFSHEQMNPLNCIIANSSVIQKRFINIINTIKFKLHEKKTNTETLKLLMAIEQSSKCLWYFN